MTLFLIGLFGFLAIHMTQVVAPGVRNGFIQKVGKLPWMALYGLISLGFFVLLSMGYSDAQLATQTFGEPPVGLKHLNTLFAPIALILFFAGSLPRGYIQKTLKHPQLVGVKLWAVGHLLANWDSTSFILFGSLLAWAVIVRISIKRREPVANPPAPSALWDGISVILGGAATAFFILHAHVAWFGKPPIPIG